MKDFTKSLGMKASRIALGAVVLFFLGLGSASAAVDSFYVLNAKAGVNGQLECYSPVNVSEAAGKLTIKTVAQKTTCGSSTAAYGSGAVVWSSFAFTYGTIVFRAKMPGGQGPWPAIWLLGTDCRPPNANTYNASGCHWPAAGSDEIDIAEILNSDHTSVNQQVHTSSGSPGCSAHATDVSQTAHEYALVWSQSQMIFKIDGETTCTLNAAAGDPISSTPKFLLANTAVGGCCGGNPDDSTFPQTMEISSIDVYAAAAYPPTGTPTYHYAPAGGSTTTAPPTAPQATVGAHSSTLTWSYSLGTAVPAGLVGTKIYRCSPAPCVPTLTTALAQVAAPGLTYQDSAVEAGKAYVYFLTALYPATAGGESGPSNSVTATIPGTTPPTALSFTTSGLPGGTVGAPYTATLAATGGVPPYMFSTSTAPPGLSPNASSGAITGTPSAAGTYNVAVTATDSSAPALTALASFTVVIAPQPPPPPPPSGNPISVNFVGTGTAMAATESAGKTPATHWNSAAGAASSAPLALVDSSGAPTGATLTWSSDNTWVLPGTLAAGNARMMGGYLDTKNGKATKIVAANLPSGSYNVIVYADGDNGTASRAGVYAIAGAVPPSVTLTDAAKTNFSGSFTASNSTTFTLTNVTGFTLTGTPGTASDGTARAPINGIQIIPLSLGPPPPPPVTVSIAPTTAALVTGQMIQFTQTVTGSTNTAVTWTTSAPAGSISATGSFTAPTAGTYTVTATSQADQTKSASVTVTVTAPKPTLAVDCSLVKPALSAANIPSGTLFNVSVTSDGVTAICSGVMP